MVMGLPVAPLAVMMTLPVYEPAESAALLAETVTVPSLAAALSQLAEEPFAIVTKTV
jgi:hypothetical protein